MDPQRRPGPNRKEREVGTTSSVGGCSRNSLGISDGTGIGILKIEEADDGHCRSSYDEDLTTNLHREVVDDVGTS